MIKKHKLYYLVHPATTYGTLAENKKSAAEIKEYLTTYFKVNVINPLEIFAGDAPWEEVMDQCYPVINQCTGIVLSPNWLKSKGCRSEALHAMENGKEIYFVLSVLIDGEEDYGLAPATYEDIKSMLNPVKTGLSVRVEKSVHLEMFEDRIELREFHHGSEKPYVQVIDPKVISKFIFTTGDESSIVEPVFDADEVLDDVLESIDTSINFEAAAARIRQDPGELLESRNVLVNVGNQDQLGIFELDEDGAIQQNPTTRLYMNRNTARLLRKVLEDLINGLPTLICNDKDFYIAPMAFTSPSALHLGIRGSSGKTRIERLDEKDLVIVRANKKKAVRLKADLLSFGDGTVVEISKGDSQPFHLSGFQTYALMRLLQENYSLSPI